ncbi:hypothetical protein C8D87_1163 [Lentzea atacamensis]|uniref:Transposase n=1 Tax=Lentzea atacamensis TaxID=531938 RepID=A0ABX9DVP9_9PSEU|nr:hypothetical protein C8D87_1163 [Lentzea atacamensis]
MHGHLLLLGFDMPTKGSQVGFSYAWVLEREVQRLT